MKKIIDIASALQLTEEEIIPYGYYKAKIKSKNKLERGNVILITAMNPTPYGEGKTTVAIGLNDAMRKINLNSIAVLREPSLGPVFGLKGGACGGGKAQIVPSEDINLHFNGDFHAITAANNLIAACIDNVIFNGNELNIDSNKIYFKRAIDMNDRSLRNIIINMDGRKNGNQREEQFQITAACEIMSLFCIANNIEDFEIRLNQIMIADDLDGNKLYVKDLNITGSIMALLLDALKPNLVQSLEENPVIVHGGPFANLSTGVSSIISLKEARANCDYVITEAGFSFDLGGHKFLDIITRRANIDPLVVVFILTTRALKHYGNGNLKLGLENTKFYIETLNKMNLNYVFTINTFADDTEEELREVESFINNLNCVCIRNNVFNEGSEGALELATYLSTLEKKKPNLFYEVSDSLEDKIKKICIHLLHSTNINYTEHAKSLLKEYEEKYPNHLICIAKTPLSLSDNKDNLQFKQNELLTITNLTVQNSTELIIVHMGNTLVMPGLPKQPNANKIKVVNEQIQNLT